MRVDLRCWKNSCSLKQLLLLLPAPVLLSWPAAAAAAAAAAVASAGSWVMLTSKPSACTQQTVHDCKRVINKGNASHVADTPAARMLM
jgi:hypothetical protein